MVPRPEHPRPLLYREPWITLNGQWDFGIGRENQDRRIMVPFPPESKLSGVGIRDFMPLVRYRRSFRLPREMVGRRVFLNFGAVDYEAQVWLNDQYLGDHRGGYTPFTFEVTSALTEGENTIELEARDDNRTGLQPCGKQSTKLDSYGCRYTRVTGIWQTVWLEAVGPVCVKRISVGQSKPTGRIWVIADVDGSARGEVGVEIEKDGDVVERGRGPASRDTKVPIEMKDLELWDPKDPNLYDVRLVLKEKGEVLDEVRSYFGIRTVEIQGESMLINGGRIFQRLVLDQGYYPEGIYTASTDSDLRRDIEISKEMGFNGARLHQKVFEPRFLYWADGLGYLVWGEFPSWGLDMSNPQACQNFISEWSEVIRRDMNHPSVIGWCPFNETPIDQNKGLVRAVYDLTKAMDPGRPVIDTSGYTHVRTDVYDSHDYDQDVEAFRERHRSILRKGEPYRNHPRQDVPYEGQPVMVSEFGGTWWNPGQTGHAAWGYGDRPRSQQEFLDRYGKLVGSLLDNPKMAGFCYTQLYDIEQEVNGLHAYDRIPKFDPEVIRAMTSREAEYEIRGA